MEHLASGITVAALSGLTFIAYKHPDAYWKLYLLLLGLCSVSAIAYFSFINGYDYSIKVLSNSKTLNMDVKAGAMSTLTKHEISYLPFAVIVAINLYLIFLSSFPMWLIKKE